MNLKHTLIVAAVAALLSAAAAQGAPLVTLSIVGSTTGIAGSFSSTVSAASGSTIYYQILAQYNSGAVNASTTHVPNGAADSFNSLPAFSFEDTLTGSNSVSFSNGTMQSGLGAGTGAGVDPSQYPGIPANEIVVRAVDSSGVYANADSALEVASGSITLDSSSPDSITGAYYATSGLLHVAGANLVSVTATTEEGADPILSYQALGINPATTPEPTSLCLLALAAGLLIRRRRQA